MHQDGADQFGGNHVDGWEPADAEDRHQYERAAEDDSDICIFLFAPCGGGLQRVYSASRNR